VRNWEVRFALNNGHRQRDLSGLRSAKERTSAKAGAMSVSGQKVALGADAQHYFTGTSAGAPLSLIRNTRNFTGWVALAFRSDEQ